MGFWARLFGAIPKDEWDGIRLDGSELWCVSPTKDVERFLRALSLLAPEGSVLYVEGAGESHVADYLAQRTIEPQVKVAVGTIWPRPDNYHIPLTQETMEALATFLDQNPAGSFCSHCHVYCEGAILLQWYDAFTDPIAVSRTIGQITIERFANAIGSTYEIALAEIEKS